MSVEQATAAERKTHARAAVDPELLAAHVTRVVNNAPPLSSEQRDKIAALLRAPATRSDREATSA